MVSMRQYADDWQLRIMKSAILSQIESTKNHESSDYEEWLLYIEEEYDEGDDYVCLDDNSRNVSGG